MPQTLTRIAATALLALAAAWANAQAGDWGDVTIVSGTVGNNPNRLCMGVPDYMRPADIGCPSYAPSLSTAGHVSITGNVSAQKFIGDGSGITNLNVQGDRIVSGTSDVTVARHGSVTISTAGGQRLVIGDTGRVGIGASNPATKLHVDSASFNDHLLITRSGAGYHLTQSGNVGSIGAYGTTNQFQIFGSNLVVATGGNIGIGTTNPNAKLDVQGLISASSVMASAINGRSIQIDPINANIGYTGDNALHINRFGPRKLLLNLGGGNVGISTTDPTAKLEVNGDISATNLRLSGNLYVSGSQSIDGVVFANGGVSATGVVTATAFYGDGSGLSGLTTAASSTGAVQFSRGDGSLGGDAANFVWDNARKELNVGSFVMSHNGTAAILGNRNTTAAVYNLLTISGTSHTGSGNVVFSFDNAGQFLTNAASLRFVTSGGQVAAIKNEGMSVKSAGQYLFSFDPNPAGTPDTGLGRVSAGIAKATNGSTGYGDFWAKEISATNLRLSGNLYVSGSQSIDGVTFANGGVSATGTVSGTYGYFRYISGSEIYGTFTGDGSGLTGVTAGSSDRIVSGTNNATSMVAISGTGYISITQAGANAGWFDPYRGLVTLGVSATGPVSATAGYFSGNVGAGTPVPTATLQVSGSFIVSSTLTGVNPAFQVSTSGRVGIGVASGAAMVEISPTTAAIVPLALYQAQNGGAALQFKYGLSLTSGNIRLVSGGGPAIGGNPYVDIGHVSSGYAAVARFSTGYTGMAGLTLSPSNTQAGLNVASGGKFSANFAQSVGIGFNMPSAGMNTWAPSATLHVSGTIRIADGGEACDGDRAGAIRYTSSSLFEFCKGSGWESMANAAGNVQSDRIVSGSTRVLASEDRSVTVRTAGNDRVVIGENGFVGIGTSTPQYLLSVNGAGLFDSGVITPKVNPLVDGVSAFQINNAGNTQTIFGVDTTNRRVGIAIGENAPSATLHVSGTIKVAGTGAEACDANMRGGMRRNPSSGLMELCQ